MYLCFISFQAKTIDSSKIDAVDRESPVSLSDPPLATKFNSTVSPAKTKQAHLPANEGEHFSFLNAGRKVCVASRDRLSIFSGGKYPSTSKEPPCVPLSGSRLCFRTC